MDFTTQIDDYVSLKSEFTEAKLQLSQYQFYKYRETK